MRVPVFWSKCATRLKSYRFALRWFSSFLIAFGGLLLLCSGVYAAYALYATSNIAGQTQPFDDYVYQPSNPIAFATEDVPTDDGAPKGDMGMEGDGVGSFLDMLRSTIFRIRIPRIEVDSKVTHLGTIVNEHGELVWDTPKNTVGHHEGTPFPGDVGNVVFSGHISSPLRNEGNVFSLLPNLEKDDVVFLETPKGTYTYRVIGKQVVLPTAIEVMNPTPYPAITLITCYPDYIYTHRLIVRAALESLEPWADLTEG